MSGPHSLSPLDPSAFEMIEAAVAETSRGRWFLAEYARRNRNADTEMLLGAIGKLENAVAGERAPEGFGRLRGDLMEMANAIARTKAEMAAISAPNQDQSRLGVASEALDAIVRATERATSDILGAAEEVQEAAWTLRESGADGAVCDELDRRATQIYTACSFQDLTAQRTGRIVHTLRYLEERLIAMIAIWGEEEEVPPAPGERQGAADPVLDDLCQSDVDRYIDMEPAAQAPAPPPARAPLPIHEDLIFVPSTGDAGIAFEQAADLVSSEPAPAALEEEAAGTADLFDVSFDLAADEEAPVQAAALDHEEDAPAAAVTDGEGDAPAAKPTSEPMLEFADLDDLTLEEKLALFT